MVFKVSGSRNGTFAAGPSYPAMSTYSGHTSANIQSDDDHGSSPNNYCSLQSYGLEVSEIRDRTFAAGKGLKEISITYEDDRKTFHLN